MKKITFILAFMLSMSALKAQTFDQSYHETFDSDSLGWTLCNMKNDQAIRSSIEKSVLTLESGKFTHPQTGQVTYGYSESFCYMPISVAEDFKIVMHLKYRNTTWDCGFRFNERDDGNFYAVTFMEWAKKVRFSRFENGVEVGGLTQGYAYPSIKRKEWNEVVVEKTGSVITISIQGQQIFKIKDAPVNYSGFSFFTYGDQSMMVDDVKFIEQ